MTRTPHQRPRYNDFRNSTAGFHVILRQSHQTLRQVIELNLQQTPRCKGRNKQAWKNAMQGMAIFEASMQHGQAGTSQVIDRSEYRDQRLGIMQPYFFPYLGYFGLIANTDRWIVFDPVQYIRKGWVNRNRILKQGGGLKYTGTTYVHSDLQEKCSFADPEMHL